MLSLLKERKYRLVLAANFISLFGSGLNHAGIIWYVLQQTHSESAVALLVSIITVPSLLSLPFSGLLIDRVDRRHLAITMDAIRALAVGVVAFSFLNGRGELWHIYAMGMLLGLFGFIHWSNLMALIQELVEGRQAVPVNALLMGAAQGGWMLAGTMVGLFYARLGLGGILAVDALTYVLSAILYYQVRRGRHIVFRRQEGAPSSFLGDLAAGFHYMMDNRPVLVLGAAAALFQAAMLSQNVLTAPLNDKILKSGATGYGLCAAGWSLGAVLASGVAGTILRHGNRATQTLWIALGVTGAACMVLPFSKVLPVAVALYFLMGGGRGLGGVSINSAFMHEVPAHLMGRTQNTYTFAGILLQLAMTFGTGWLSERLGLAVGFFLVGGGYLAGGLLSHSLRNHRPAFPAAAAVADPVLPGVPAEEG